MHFWRDVYFQEPLQPCVIANPFSAPSAQPRTLRRTLDRCTCYGKIGESTAQGCKSLGCSEAPFPSISIYILSDGARYFSIFETVPGLAASPLDQPPRER